MDHCIAKAWEKRRIATTIKLTYQKANTVIKILFCPQSKARKKQCAKKSIGDMLRNQLEIIVHMKKGESVRAVSELCSIPNSRIGDI